MKILITNVQLDHRTGTEIVVRDLEWGLRSRGHEVCVYTPRLGIISDEITERGGVVVDDLDRVPFHPDVIHAHHNRPATDAALHFPKAPLVFVCHGGRSTLDMVRGVPSVHAHVAVDLNCAERLVAEGVPQGSIHLVTNAVDLSRATHREAIDRPLRRAAVFGNNAGHGGFVEQVRTACTARGIQLDEFGSGVGRTLDRPEATLWRYDVVFAKARCAIEAIACGSAVIAIDSVGYGGLVTAANVGWMLDWNIGERCLQRPHDVEDILADLDRIDADDVRRTSDLLRDRCSLEVALDSFERIYASVIDDDPADGSLSTESWRASHDDLVAYATDLELRLRIGGPAAVPPLPPSVDAAISLVADSPPRWVPPGHRFRLDVEIINDSSEDFSSTGPTPVLLAYNWLDASGQSVLFNGERTGLRGVVRRGTSHRQSMTVVSPPEQGRLRLQPRLVQESVRWLETTSDLDGDGRMITVTEEHSIRTLVDLAALCDVTMVRDGGVSCLGFVSKPRTGMLSFASTEAILSSAVSSGCGSIIVPPWLTSRVPPEVGVIESQTPMATFWTVHESLLRDTDFYGTDSESRVHRGSRVHPSAVVDRQNVRIDADSVIGAGCVLTGRITIERGVTIHAGVVIGTGGLQTAVVDGQRVEFSHAGGVTIRRGAVVFANASIARGLFDDQTIIGEECRIGNNTFVSHGVTLGDRTTIGHGAAINGNVELGSDVWVGPGAVIVNNVAIGDRAKVDLGSTVIGSVRADEHVGGPPAIDHGTVLREVARWRRNSRR